MDSEVSFTVSTYGADEKFKRLAELRHTTVPVIIRERSGLLGVTLASYTQPVASSGGGALASGDASGLSPEAKNLGRSAVSRDLARVYVMPAAVFMTIRDGRGMKSARQFAGLMKLGKYSEAEKLLQSLGVKGSALRVEPWDDGARHRRLRNKRGRINRGTKPVITTNPTGYKAHRKKKLDNVGWSKSSWITAARQIRNAKGFSRLPAWIRKHSAPGVGIDNTQGNTDSPHIILKSLVPWIQDAFSARTNNAILQHFGDLVIKDIEHAIAYLERNAAATTGPALAA